MKTRMHCQVAVGLGTMLFLLAFLPAVIYPPDGNSMLEVAISLVTKGNFTVPEAGMGSVGIGGALYSNWYPLLSIVSAPLVAVGVLIAGIKHLPVHYTAGVFALVLSASLTAATAYVVVGLALRLGSSKRDAVIAAVAYTFGTIAIVYARDFFAEPLLALITAAAVYLQLGNASERRGAAVLTALAVLAKPTGIILGPALALHAALRERSARAAWLPLLGTVTGISIYALYNAHRFGNPLMFGPPTDQLKVSNLWIGLSVLLFSPGRGLIWYCPVILALLGVHVQIVKRLDVGLILAVALAYLLIYSLWSFPEGGWSWGPRFLLPALPGLLALGVFLEDGWRRCLILLTLLGFVVNSPTLVSFYYRIYQEEVYAQEETSLWSFSEAPLVKIWGSTTRELRDAQSTDVRLLVRHAGEPADDLPQNWRTLRIVNLWWWMLPAARMPRVFGAALSAIFAAIGLLLIASALASNRLQL